MKKNLLKGLIGLGIFIMFMVNVNAETIDLENVSTTGQTVTVGDVDVPIYSVDIEWGDMTFDWKYDSETGNFGFKAKLGCDAYVMSPEDTTLTAAKELGYLYSDNTCANLQTVDLIEGNTYYQKTKVGGKISVVDNSVNGYVSAYVEFNPSQDYEWVTGKFAESYVLSLGTGKIEYENEIVDGYIPRTIGIDEVKLEAFLYLEEADNAVRTNEVKSNDEIGTVTININPM